MLGDNKLSDALPTEIQALTNLKMLMLNNNQFTGELQLPSAMDLCKFQCSYQCFYQLQRKM